jgi:hypothetical protein
VTILCDKTTLSLRMTLSLCLTITRTTNIQQTTKTRKVFLQITKTKKISIPNIYEKVCYQMISMNSLRFQLLKKTKSGLVSLQSLRQHFFMWILGLYVIWSISLWINQSCETCLVIILHCILSSKSIRIHSKILGFNSTSLFLLKENSVVATVYEQMTKLKTMHWSDMSLGTFETKLEFDTDKLSFIYYTNMRLQNMY